MTFPYKKGKNPTKLMFFHFVIFNKRITDICHRAILRMGAVGAHRFCKDAQTAPCVYQHSVIILVAPVD